MKQFHLKIANVDRYITVRWDDAVIYSGKTDTCWQSVWKTTEGEHQLEIRFGKRPQPSVLDVMPRGLFAEGYGKYKHIPIQLFAPYCQFYNGTYRATVQISTQKGDASLHLRLMQKEYESYLATVWTKSTVRVEEMHKCSIHDASERIFENRKQQCAAILVQVLWLVLYYGIWGAWWTYGMIGGIQHTVQMAPHVSCEEQAIGCGVCLSLILVKFVFNAARLALVGMRNSDG
ncbi:MAG: hypothetical protein IJY28_08070, partial [Clostridia bacterium]|nr:hypothetical protein [Clostridia bacterium]